MRLCKRFEQKVSAYLEGALEERQRQIVESHLQDCPQCASIALRLGKLKWYLKNLPQRKPSSEFDIVMNARLRREMLQQRKSTFENLLEGVFPRWVPVAGASVVLVILGVILMWNHSRHSEGRPGSLTEVPTQVAPSLASSPALTDSAGPTVNYVLDHVTLEQLLSRGKKYSLDERPRSLGISPDSSNSRGTSSPSQGQFPGGQIRAVTF